MDSDSDDAIPAELAHAYPIEDEPQQARFLGILALGLLGFLILGALFGIFQAIF